MRVVSFVGVVALALSAAVAAQPVVTFEKDAAVARGLSPSGEVVWFSVARETAQMVSRVTTRQAVAPTDAEGVVVCQVEGVVPAVSVWAVVDLTTGDYAVVAPPGAPLRDRSPADRQMNPGLSRVSLKVGTRTADRIHVLLVRPGAGAWSSVAWDGGPTDSDKATDGAPSLDLDTLTPLGRSAAPPKSLLKGDVLVTVRPRDLAFSAVTVAAGTSE